MLPSPCRRCGTPAIGGLCEQHRLEMVRARTAARGTRASQGYDTGYDRARRELAARFIAGETRCCLCGDPIQTLGELSAEHVNGKTDTLLAPAHRTCNYRDSARHRPNRSQG